MMRAKLENVEKSGTNLSVHREIESLTRAIDKELSLMAIYPKGKGDEFKFWVQDNNPGIFAWNA